MPHGHDALICHHPPDGHAELADGVVSVANQDGDMLSRHAGHQCFLKLLLKGLYGLVRHLFGLN